MGIRAVNTPVESSPLPTIEALIEGKGTEASAAPQEKATEPKEESSQLDRIEREQKHRRELFAQQKRIKELEQKLGDTSNKASILDAKNPIKELSRQKGMTQDDVIKMALEAMDDDLTDGEKKAELKDMSPEAIAKLVREQMDAEKAKEAGAEASKKAVADFKVKISEQAKVLAEKHPLVDALKGSDAAFDLINAQFNADVEQYGEEYAQENMMSIDDAIKKTDETLAKNVKDALQSKYLRDFILKAIKEDGIKEKAPSQSNDEDEQLEDEAVTLTNNGHRAGTEPAGKPKFSSDQDELNYLINNYI